MYRIIGADGNQYGPISADQLRQWIAEGRANAQTKVLAEGTTEWKPLSEFPEFFPSTSAPGAMPPPSPAPGIPTMQPLGSYGYPGTAEQVNGPAIGLIVVAIVGFLAQAFIMVWRLFFSAVAAAQSSQPEWMTMLSSGTTTVVSAILGILSSILVLFGGLKMKRLESYGLAMAASIIAMIPCVSPCCLIGLPLGIWSVVILAKPEVKAAFH